MKVVKASVDLATWVIQQECITCKSELEICATDIRYRYEIDSNKCYYASCMLCSGIMYINLNFLPQIVRTDVNKHRSDKTYSCSY